MMRLSLVILFLFVIGGCGNRQEESNLSGNHSHSQDQANAHSHGHSHGHSHDHEERDVDVSGVASDSQMSNGETKLEEDSRQDLMQYDSNGDGKVSKSEIPQRAGTLFDRMDSNGDGVVDLDEGTF